jgi:hypothetical protein
VLPLTSFTCAALSQGKRAMILVSPSWHRCTVHAADAPTIAAIAR